MATVGGDLCPAVFSDGGTAFGRYNDDNDLFFGYRENHQITPGGAAGSVRLLLTKNPVFVP